MYQLVKPLLFKLDAELTHDLALRFLAFAGSASVLRALMPSAVEDSVELMGLTFRNRVGVAAGLDKNACCIASLQALGFGSIEVGTVTPRAQSGNPKPRLFRLATEESIINRMGFNNDGVEQLVERVQLAKRQLRVPLGINIGKNKSTAQMDAVSDYLACLSAVAPLADYVTVNLSSPNTPGLRDLQFGEELSQLLGSLCDQRKQLEDQLQKSLPLLVKIAPDMARDDLFSVADSLVANDIDGVIATNTTIERSAVTDSIYAKESGGLSGRALTEKSTDTIRALAGHLGKSLVIVGVGGIHSGQDAVDKITAGADIVQLYSGLVYRGPRLVNEAAAAIRRHIELASE